MLKSPEKSWMQRSSREYLIFHSLEILGILLEIFLIFPKQENTNKSNIN